MPQSSLKLIPVNVEALSFIFTIYFILQPLTEDQIYYKIFHISLLFLYCSRLCLYMYLWIGKERIVLLILPRKCDTFRTTAFLLGVPNNKNKIKEIRQSHSWPLKLPHTIFALETIFWALEKRCTPLYFSIIQRPIDYCTLRFGHSIRQLNTAFIIKLMLSSVITNFTWNFSCFTCINNWTIKQLHFVKTQLYLLFHN